MRLVWTRSGVKPTPAFALSPTAIYLISLADIDLKRKRKLSTIRVIGPPQRSRRHTEGCHENSRSV